MKKQTERANGQESGSGRQRRRWRLAMALVLGAVLAAPVWAEKIGDYYREDQAIGAVDADISRVEGLLFALHADRGVETNAAGAVTAWRASEGRNFVLKSSPENGSEQAAAERPVRKIENVIPGRAGLALVCSDKAVSILRGAEPVEIEPARGLTLFAVARVDEQYHFNHILAFRGDYLAPGSPGSATLSLKTISAGQSALSSYLGVAPDAGAGAAGTWLVAPEADAVGKGLIVAAVRVDPQAGEQTLYENGSAVARAARRDPLAKSQPVAIGGGGSRSWGGMVLAVRAYNRALDEREMRAVNGALMAEFGLGGKPVSGMARLLPYAYYPSRNEMEAAIDLSPELRAKAGGRPEAVTVRVLEAGGGRVVATGKVPLDPQGRGQAVFAVPDFPDGDYAVEYVIGAHVERSPKTFKRIHFPFEKTNYGVSHEVFPPFEPVRVNGATVSVVGRRYTVNAQGLFDSVVSLDRELLAAPMRLVVELADGSRVNWEPDGGWFTKAIKGRSVHPDEAVFECAAGSAVCSLRSVVTVQEDGCAKVTMTLSPDTRHPTPSSALWATEGKRDTRALTPDTRHLTPISRAWLEIPLKDAEAPLFHYIAENGMRFNYAGATPRGGKIEWYSEKWDRGVPIRWRATEPEPTDPKREVVFWTSADPKTYSNEHAWDYRPFVPYLWLGAEERGLAFFMENERGFVTDYPRPLQRVARRGDQVIVRIDVIQAPTALTAPRTIEFGLMASPGKPMEREFRGRNFASGVGGVECWGGWECASKYPDNHDWSIVDKFQDLRRRGQYTPEDNAFFTAKGAEVKARWPDRRIQDDPNGRDWESYWKMVAEKFAYKARTRPDKGRSISGTYFEVHGTDTRLPEWQVFQDEWASSEFNRFRDKPANWGVFTPSYHDFALYMANEWMKRGVSLYFDCANPKRCYNERFGPAYRTPSGALVYGISIFGHRDYYRRIYKLLSDWNRRGLEHPVDFTVHITNTQTLPLNTWATATLDLESNPPHEDPAKVPAEVPGLEAPGFQTTWAPEYTRTTTFGRQVGAIPLALDFVSGHNRSEAQLLTREMLLRNWAMCRIHDVRPYSGAWYLFGQKTSDLARQCEDVCARFGYGSTALTTGGLVEQVEHHNYWEEKPFLRVNDERVKWLALVRKPVAGAAGAAAGDPAKPETADGLALLQSYSPTDAIAAEIVFPGAVAFRDAVTGEAIPAPAGRAVVKLPAPYGTRLLLVETAKGRP